MLFKLLLMSLLKLPPRPFLNARLSVILCIPSFLLASSGLCAQEPKSYAPLPSYTATNSAVQSTHTQAGGKASADAAAQLILMAAAIDNKSYKGTLTYEFGGPLEALMFERRFVGSGTQEHIRHLSGKPRHFSRMLPQQHCSNAAMRLFMQAGSAPLQYLSRFYRFNTLGVKRIADRAANIIHVQPVRDDRYSFTLGIDQGSHLPLMLAISDNRGHVLERFQFVEFDLNNAKVFEGFQAAKAVHKLPFVQADCETPQVLNGWQPSWLPSDMT